MGTIGLRNRTSSYAEVHSLPDHPPRFARLPPKGDSTWGSIARLPLTGDSTLGFYREAPSEGRQHVGVLSRGSLGRETVGYGETGFAHT